MITCPRCRSKIPPENINVQTSVAKCISCGEVFNFTAQIPGPALAPSKPTVQMPKCFTLAYQLSDLVLTRRWFSGKIVALAAFCLFWDGFLVFWYSIALSQHILIMALFPILHVAVGVYLTYTVLAGFFNHTEFRISTGRVAVRHYPLPWPGNQVIPSQEIDQLFCSEKISNSRNGTSVTYTVNVDLKGGRRIKLVSSLDAPDQALYIEQQIESCLGIADRPVAGEMRPV